MPDLIIPSRITFVALRKLTAILILVALLASTGIAEAIPCTVNCAFAGLRHAQHRHMHHPEVASNQHHHHHMDMSANAPQSNELALRSGRCTAYSEFVAQAAVSRFVLTRNIEFESNLAVTRDASALAIPALDFSIPAPSGSPPNRSLNPVTPIRI